jgi:hypothetical protein
MKKLLLGLACASLILSGCASTPYTSSSLPTKYYTNRSTSAELPTYRLQRSGEMSEMPMMGDPILTPDASGNYQIQRSGEMPEMPMMGDPVWVPQN